MAWSVQAVRVAAKEAAAKVEEAQGHCSEAKAGGWVAVVWAA